MIRRLSTISIIMLLLLPPFVFAKSEPDKTQQKMSGAIRTESQAQAQADQWSSNGADMVNEIRELRTRLTWLQYQKKKYETYIQVVKDNINDLQTRKLEARKLRENLEPYLEEVVSRLEAFVAQDLPFLADERRQRLNFLKTTLNDYHLDLGEKLRRIYEALGAEASYGKMVTSSDETIKLDGLDTEVKVLRIGRLAMFYQSLDAAKIGIWNQQSGVVWGQSGQWEPLPKDFAQVIRRGLEMARRERSVQLIQLPLGAVTQ